MGLPDRFRAKRLAAWSSSHLGGLTRVAKVLTLPVVLALFVGACANDGDDIPKNNTVHFVDATVGHLEALPRGEDLRPGERQDDSGCFVLRERFARFSKGERLCNSLDLADDTPLPEKDDAVTLAVVVYNRDPDRGGGSYRIIDIFNEGDERKDP